MPREGALPQREADAGFSEAEVVYRKGLYRAIPAPDCTNGLASELTHSWSTLPARHVTELLLKRGPSPSKEREVPRELRLSIYTNGRATSLRQLC